MVTLTVDRHLLTLGGLLAGVSMGMPWGVRQEQLLDVTLPFAVPVPVGGTNWTFPDSVDLDVAVPVVVHGLEHPVRVLAVVGAVLVWWAVRHGSRLTAWLGLLVAAAALPLGGTAGSGRVVLAAGLVVVTVALLRASGPAPPDGQRRTGVRDAPQPAARLR
jgi:hypothetical protein